MPQTVSYQHVIPESALPVIATPVASRVIVIAEAAVTPEWQSLVSQWIVQSGCLYMMAWGTNCSTWDDSVDMANVEEFSFGEIPESRFVMTTWHADETLPEVFCFSKNGADHPTVNLEHTVLLHIAQQENMKKMLFEYAAA